MIASDASIQVNVGWRIRGTWSSRNWYEGTFGHDWSLGLIARVPVALDVPSGIISDDSIWGNYAGSDCDLQVGQPRIHFSCIGFQAIGRACVDSISHLHGLRYMACITVRRFTLGCKVQGDIGFQLLRSWNSSNQSSQVSSSARFYLELIAWAMVASKPLSGIASGSCLDYQYTSLPELMIDKNSTLQWSSNLWILKIWEAMSLESVVQFACIVYSPLVYLNVCFSVQYLGFKYILRVLGID